MAEANNGNTLLSSFPPPNEIFICDNSIYFISDAQTVAVTTQGAVNFEALSAYPGLFDSINNLYFEEAPFEQVDDPYTLDTKLGVHVQILLDGAFGILGEHPNDHNKPIQGVFVSGIHGFEDVTVHKLFRRMGLDASASPQDKIEMSVRALDYDTAYEGLPKREVNQSLWDVDRWDAATWSGPIDTTQTTSLPDNIQGRYLQFALKFDTLDGNYVSIHGPVSVEYRLRYRHGRR